MNGLISIYAVPPFQNDMVLGWIPRVQLSKTWESFRT